MLAVSAIKPATMFLRQQRFFERQKALGLITPEMVLPVFLKRIPDGKRPAWTELTPQQQEKWITDMATYAASIEIMDSGIVVAHRP